MSGGHFNYTQYRMQDTACRMEDYLNGVPLDDYEAIDYIDTHNLTDEEIKWVKENKRALPNYCKYSKETLEEIKKGLDILNKATIYVERIDGLMSGDDSEETFLKRLKDDLKMQDPRYSIWDAILSS